MPTCRECGRENPPMARFCNACGASLPAEPREVRKTVTVVFADLVGSTALGERLDPEALRGVMRRYHELLRAILERHGGMVEKFIGDAVMAVFGLPQVHEDDALRAVRAAAELRDAVAPLGLQVRIGVNTGDVVAGYGETLVTGDAVNVAARLEQAAAPGEILIGELTHRLVVNAVRTEALGGLSLKGKAGHVPAFRVRQVLAEVPAFTRRVDAPFVGRDAQLRELEQTYERAVEDRTCRLSTIVGLPGVGKSRLARELLGGVDAQVLVGRCLPYGEGITYWPLAEIIDQLPGAVAEIVAGDENADVIAARIAGAIGVAQGGGAAEEIAWAFRKLLERLARDRPVIAVVDDIHWAEATLLDLLEYVVTFSSGSPMLLLCLARPELFDHRPSWSNPRPNATMVVLDPLSERDTRDLAEQLIGPGRFSEESRARVVEAAEGNPLFLEQLLAMHSEGEGGELEIPPTIQALLAARIDRLAPQERSVIECASIEGRLFHRGAVAKLVPDEVRPQVGSHLITLARGELIRADRALFAGDDAFRFGHILIRDAAYDSIPKRVRAELHEQFAAWLERVVGERESEFEEVLGYHLEQAQAYRLELDAADATARRLGLFASRRLRRAGENAKARGDLRAAVNLLERAAAAGPADDREHPAILESLATAQMHAGNFPAAQAAYEESIAAADAQDDRRVCARAAAGRLRLLILTSQAAPDTAMEEAERLIPVLEELGDDVGLATAWFVVLDSHNHHLRTGAMMHAAERALEHARRARAGREEAEAAFWLATCAAMGTEPASAAAARCAQLLAEAPGPVVEAHVKMALAVIRAFECDFDGARRLYTEARDTYVDLGITVMAAGYGNLAGPVEILAGDLAMAEAVLRTSDRELAEIGESGYRSTVLALLAATLCQQGRDAEAEQLAAESLAIMPGDAANEVICGGVKAVIAARRGELDRAIELAEAAVARAGAEGVETFSHPDAYMDLAEVMRLAGRRDGEVAALREALRLYEQKENRAAAAKARTLLEVASPGPLAVPREEQSSVPLQPANGSRGPAAS